MADPVDELERDRRQLERSLLGVEPLPEGVPLLGTAPPPEPEPGITPETAGFQGQSEFARGLEQSSVQGDMTRIGLQIQRAASLGDQREVDRLRPMYEAAQRRATFVGPRIQSLSEAETTEDAIDFVLGGVGSQGPQLLKTAAGGVLGGIAGGLVAGPAGVGVGAGLGAGAVSTALETAEGAPEAAFADDSRFTLKERAQLNMVAGIARGSLDAFPAIRLLRRMPVFRGVDVRKEVVRHIDSSRLVAAAKQGFAEGGTEIVQETIGMATQRFIEDHWEKFTSEELYQLADAFVLGATLGGGLGGIIRERSSGALSDSEKKLLQRLDAHLSGEKTLEDQIQDEADGKDSMSGTDASGVEPVVTERKLEEESEQQAREGIADEADRAAREELADDVEKFKAAARAKGKEVGDLGRRAMRFIRAVGKRRTRKVKNFTQKKLDRMRTAVDETDARLEERFDPENATDQGWIRFAKNAAQRLRERFVTDDGGLPSATPIAGEINTREVRRVIADLDRIDQLSERIKDPQFTDSQKDVLRKRLAEAVNKVKKSKAAFKVVETLNAEPKQEIHPEVQEYIRDAIARGRPVETLMELFGLTEGDIHFITTADERVLMRSRSELDQQEILEQDNDVRAEIQALGLEELGPLQATFDNLSGADLDVLLAPEGQAAIEEDTEMQATAKEMEAAANVLGFQVEEEPTGPQPLVLPNGRLKVGLSRAASKNPGKPTAIEKLVDNFNMTHGPRAGLVRRLQKFSKFIEEAVRKAPNERNAAETQVVGDERIMTRGLEERLRKAYFVKADKSFGDYWVVIEEESDPDVTTAVPYLLTTAEVEDSHAKRTDTKDLAVDPHNAVDVDGIKINLPRLTGFARKALLFRSPKFWEGTLDTARTSAKEKGQFVPRTHLEQAVIAYYHGIADLIIRGVIDTWPTLRDRQVMYSTQVGGKTVHVTWEMVKDLGITNDFRNVARDMPKYLIARFETQISRHKTMLDRVNDLETALEKGPNPALERELRKLRKAQGKAQDFFKTTGINPNTVKLDLNGDVENLNDYMAVVKRATTLGLADQFRQEQPRIGQAYREEIKKLKAELKGLQRRTDDESAARVVKNKERIAQMEKFLNSSFDEQLAIYYEQTAADRNAADFAGKVGMTGAIDIAGHAAKIRGLANRKREQELPEATRKARVAKQDRLHKLQERENQTGSGTPIVTGKVVVAGSRDVDMTVDELHAVLEGAGANPFEVVSGTARGIDSLGEAWAAVHNIAVKRFPAKWKELGKSAGFKRNEQMAKYGDALVAIWDGKSRGTMHMINLAKKHGLTVYVYNTSTGKGSFVSGVGIKLSAEEKAEMKRLRKEIAETYTPAEQRKIKRFQGIYAIKTEIDLLLDNTDSQVFFGKIDDLRQAMGLHIPDRKYTGYVKETLALAREEIDNFRFAYIARDQQTDLQEIIGNIELDVANTITDIKEAPDVTHNGALFDAPEEISALIARDQLVTPTAARGTLRERIDPKKPVPDKPGVLERRGAEGFGRARVADAALGRLPTLMTPVQQFHWIQHSIEGFLADLNMPLTARLEGKTLEQLRTLWHNNFGGGLDQKKVLAQFAQEWASTQHIRVESALQAIELELFRMARVNVAAKDGVPTIDTFSELKKVLPNNPRVRALLSERERVVKNRKNIDPDTLAFVSDTEILSPHFTVYGVAQDATLEERTNAARRQFTPNLKIPVGKGEVTAPTPFFTELEARKRYLAWAEWANSEKAPNLPLPTGTYRNVLIPKDESQTAVNLVNAALERITESVRETGVTTMLDEQLFTDRTLKIETVADLLVYLDSLRATMMLKSASHQQVFSNFNRESYARQTTEDSLPSDTIDPGVGGRTADRNTWEMVRSLIDTMGFAVFDGPTDPKDMGGKAGWYQLSTNTIKLLATLNKTWAVGTAGHEAMHALWFQTLHPAERAALAKAFRSDASVENILNFYRAMGVSGQFIRDLRRAMDPRTNPEHAIAERVAYAFGAFVVGRIRTDLPNFRIPKQPHTIFEKVWAIIKQIIRYTNPEEQSQNLFELAINGDIKQAHIQGRRVSLRNEGFGIAPGAAVDAIWNAWRASQHLVRGYIIPFDSGLRNTRIPALIQLADTVFVGPLYRTIKNAGPTFLSDYTRQQIKWTSVFQRKWETLSPQRRAKVRDALYSRTELADLDQQTAADVRWFRAFFNQMRAYVTKTKADLGDVPNFVPIHWDAQRVVDNEAELRAILETVDPKEIKNAGGIDAIVDHLKRNPDVMGEDRFSANFDTREVSARKRHYAFLNDKNLSSFMNQDLEGTMMGYIRQMTRYAESTRHFGVDGVKVKQLLVKAKEQGATPKELDDAHNYLLAARGQLGANISESMSKTLAWIATYQHVRVLAFATFASFVEVVGIATRSQSVDATWEALKVAWDQVKNLYTNFPRQREIKKRLKELTEKTTLRPEEDVEFENLTKELQQMETDHDRFAREMGTLDGAVMFDQLIAASGAVPMESWPKRINEAFFKWNGLVGWTALTRKMATRAAYIFIKENALHPRKHSKRFLAELNLKRSDLVFDENGELLTSFSAIDAALEQQDDVRFRMDEVRQREARRRAEKLEQAIWTFVDESILRPNAANRPLRASDPHWQLLFHMKHYIFAVQHQILNRIYKEAVEHKNFVPVGLLALYPGVMFMADFFRSTIQYGLADEEDEWKNPYERYSFGELMARSTRRSGVLGILEPYTGFGENINRFGGTGFEVLTGPTIQQGLELSRTMLTGSPSAYKAMHNALPLSNVYRNWGIPFN